MKLVQTNTWPQLAKDLEKYRTIKMYVSSEMREMLPDTRSTLSWLNRYLPKFLTKHSGIINVISLKPENVNGVRKLCLIINLSMVENNQEALFLLQKGEFSQ